MVCVVATLVLYKIAVSGTAYEVTSPTSLPHHELLRKVYAVLAFALLGFLLERASVPRLRGVTAAAIVVGVYSYLIELGQIGFNQVQETFAQHGFDVASGVAGGALGALVALAIAAPRAPQRRAEALVTIALLAALAWAFTVTYGPLDSQSRYDESSRSASFTRMSGVVARCLSWISSTRSRCARRAFS